MSIDLGLVLAFGVAGLSQAEVLLQYLDLKSDPSTKSDMTREDVVAAIASQAAVSSTSPGSASTILTCRPGSEQHKAGGVLINGTDFTGSNLNGVKR